MSQTGLNNTLLDSPSNCLCVLEITLSAFEDNVFKFLQLMFYINALSEFNSDKIVHICAPISLNVIHSYKTEFIEYMCFSVPIKG